MTESGDTKDDLQLPSGTDDAEKLAQQIKIDFDAGKELQVSVMKASQGGPGRGCARPCPATPIFYLSEAPNLATLAGTACTAPRPILLCRCTACGCLLGSSPTCCAVTTPGPPVHSCQRSPGACQTQGPAERCSSLCALPCIAPLSVHMLLLAQEWQ